MYTGSPVETTISNLLVHLDQLRKAVELHGLVEDDFRGAIQNVAGFRSPDRLTGYPTETHQLAVVVAEEMAKVNAPTTATDSQITTLLNQLHDSRSALSATVTDAMSSAASSSPSPSTS